MREIHCRLRGIHGCIAFACIMVSYDADAHAAANGGPPAAATVASQAEYFGTVVSDPYRWMERVDDPALATWLNAQDQYTRRLLAGIPQRDEFRRRVEALSAATAEIKTFAKIGERYVYLKRPVGANDFSLYVRDAASSHERVVVDAASVQAPGAHHTIDFVYPSPDGKSVAFRTSADGSEESALLLVDVEIGVVGKDRIDHVVGDPQWSFDGRAIYYARLAPLPPGVSPTLKFQKVKTYAHRPGQDPRNDIAVLGIGVNPSLPIAATDLPDLFTLGASPYVVARVTRDGQVHGDLYAARADRLTDRHVTWRKIADSEDQVTLFDGHNEDVYLILNRTGESSKLVRVQLTDGDAAHGEVVIAASDRVLQGVSAARDALYVRATAGGTARLMRLPFAGGPMTEVPLPFVGSIATVVTDPLSDGALFKMQSWVRPPAIYSYAASGAISVTALLPALPIDVSHYQSLEVTVPSSGGVAVPLSIVHVRGMKLDGRAPTWLSVYGSHGTSVEPRFEPRRIAWLERGGVYAVCHARGGGERGEAWHHAGMKLQKQNTIDDALACAKFLIAGGYTAAAHLAIEGTSAGGLAAGGALTQHPELFGAAILRVPVVDPIGYERSAGGTMNTREFGSTSVREECAALLASSPYQHVRDGVAYPAVLLLTAVNDRRVPTSQAAKMAARLQAASTSSRPVLLRVEGDAGHGLVGATRAQVDGELADIYAFLSWQLARPTSAKTREAH